MKNSIAFAKFFTAIFSVVLMITIHKLIIVKLKKISIFEFKNDTSSFQNYENYTEIIRNKIKTDLSELLFRFQNGAGFDQKIIIAYMNNLDKFFDKLHEKSIQIENSSKTQEKTSSTAQKTTQKNSVESSSPSSIEEKTNIKDQ
jgi:ketol-acid reductoisomerase